jgi:5-oxoprolinase (ATP-hydrolysing)
LDRSWRFWIDRGGTFTDVIGQDSAGAETSLKLLSASPAYPDAAVEAMRRILGAGPDAPFPAARIEAIKMGTTVATNALLERAGAKTLFVTTQGFADSVLIGDQARPDLFALTIVKPAPLYSSVVEADERLDAQGGIVRPLDRVALECDLRAAADQGFTSVAIAFLHSDLNPAHELAAGDIAKALGYPFVALSHEVSPLPRFIPRAETTIADAYLTPVLQSYVQQVAKAVAGAPLFFMTSAGGLVRAEAFRGKDAVVSGPAGGVVGVARTAAEAQAPPSWASTWAGPPPTSAALPASSSGATQPRSPAPRSAAQCSTSKRWRRAAARSSPSTACAPAPAPPAPARIRARRPMGGADRPP